ncbi:hypothetical protein MJO28_015460, partial [Puccinia striiformis f. sp. tritici]
QRDAYLQLSNRGGSRGDVRRRAGLPDIEGSLKKGDRLPSPNHTLFKDSHYKMPAVKTILSQRLSWLVMSVVLLTLSSSTDIVKAAPPATLALKPGKLTEPDLDLSLGLSVYNAPADTNLQLGHSTSAERVRGVQPSTVRGNDLRLQSESPLDLGLSLGPQKAPVISPATRPTSKGAYLQLSSWEIGPSTVPAPTQVRAAARQPTSVNPDRKVTDLGKDSLELSLSPAGRNEAQPRPGGVYGQPADETVRLSTGKSKIEHNIRPSAQTHPASQLPPHLTLGPYRQVPPEETVLKYDPARGYFNEHIGGTASTREDKSRAIAGSSSQGVPQHHMITPGEALRLHAASGQYTREQISNMATNFNQYQTSRLKRTLSQINQRESSTQRQRQRISPETASNYRSSERDRSAPGAGPSSPTAPYSDLKLAL